MTKTPDFFTAEAARRYDERNAKLSRISDCLHLLTGLILKDLPERARILCVGAGTGAEILALAQTFPHWSFVAVEPSLAMLEVCRERLRQAGLAARCELTHGYVEDLGLSGDFDAALCLLVAHFVNRSERPRFLRQITQRLKIGGFFLTAEISYDLNSAEFPSMLKRWGSVQELMGANADSLAALPHQLREVLTVISPAETEALLRESGLDSPVRFFQAFLVCAWYGERSR